MLRYVRRKRRLMAETQYSVRLVKTFAYEGDPVKQWSNRYFFDGGAPTDSTAWYALMDAISAAERPCYSSAVHQLAAYGYAPNSGVAVATKAYSVAGTLATSGLVATPGDCAGVLRQATTKRSVKNHPVYVFSYFHGVYWQATPGDPDALATTQKTALENLGAAWNTGLTVGARTYKRCTPDGHLVTGSAAEIWIRHRDFPR